MPRDIPPVFCGNFEYDAPVSEIERLFDRFGRVNRVDMKTGFAFVYMDDDRDAEDAIRALDRTPFGYKRRILRVDWAKGDGMTKEREDQRRAQAKPTSTLFVVNFDARDVRERDIERHFEPHGKLRRVQIKRNFAFVQYDTVDQAQVALRATSGSMLRGREIQVEYVASEHNERGGGGGDRERRRSRSYSPVRRSRSPPRRRSRSPVYNSSPRRRSPSPRGRSRSRSPDRRSYSR